MSIGFTQMMITPESAKQLLKKNFENNRRLDWHKVDTYATDMMTGQWENGNPAPITFSPDGVLMDGQHRLAAVVKSNTPIIFTIATSEAKIFDIGKTRSAGDIARIESGIRLRSNVAGAVALRLRRGTAYRPSSAQTYHAYAADTDGWDKAYGIAIKGAGNAILRTASGILAIYDALIFGVPEEKLAQFAQATNSGFTTSEKEYAAVVLSKYLNEIKRGHTGYKEMWVRTGFIEEYIRLYCAGKSIKRKVGEPTWYYYEQTKERNNEEA